MSLLQVAVIIISMVAVFMTVMAFYMCYYQYKDKK